VQLRVAEAALERLRSVGRYSRVESVAPADPDGWCAVAMRFELENDALAALLSLGAQAEVLEPAELRAQVIEQAGRLLELYQLQPELSLEGNED
jgi:predicted DNA-binding transcriptional regulator YafY